MGTEEKHRDQGLHRVGPGEATTPKEGTILRLPRVLYRRLDRFCLQLSKLLDRPRGDSYMVTEKFVRRLAEELTRTAAATWDEQLAHRRFAGLETIAETVTEFLEVYKRRPVFDNRGGSGFHNCFWLFVLARILNPSLIVESGVWRGQSSWILSSASPEAMVHGFDVDIRKAPRETTAIRYHEMDWTEFEFADVDAGDSLCFFDCHVNQARRVREAYARGFRLLLFDDNPPTHKLAAYGAPPLPTIDMVMKSRPDPGDSIEWVWKGLPRRYVYDPADEHGARDLIARYTVLPDVGSATALGGFSFLSLVELID